MTDLKFHLAEPEAKADVYTEFANIDFNINVGEGRSLVKNSVRFLADLKILDNGARNATDIFFDPKVGAHAFVDSLQVSFLDGQNSGSKENLQNYARYVAMQEIALTSPEDALNASQLCELKGYDERTSNLFSAGRVTRNTNNPVTQDQDFSIKPVCILNKMQGGNLSYSKSGTIRLTLNLAPNRSALMGAAYNQAQDGYELRNPRVIYQSLPDTGKEPQVLMRSVYNVKNAILSSFSNTQVRVPAVCDAVTISLQQQSREQQSPFSNYQCERPIGWEEVQFLFNDTNEYITYVIKDQTEALHRAVKSFLDTGHNQVSGSRFSDNQSFLLGLSFGKFVDLSNQKFGVQLKTAIDNTTPHNIYMYFHSVMTV
jgi:hypothetical protein